MEILSIQPNWIADSELNKTVEVRIATDQGIFSGSAPQGTSAGSYEAFSEEPEIAVMNLEEIVPTIMRFDPADLRTLDTYLQERGSYRMERFGANAAVALSSAWAKMAAAANNMQLHHYLAGFLGASDNAHQSGNQHQSNIPHQPRMPVPAFNIINGGAHGGIDEHGNPYNPIQEIMLVPYSANTFEQAYSMAMNVFQQLKEVSGEALVGKEGGISPQKPLEESLDLIASAIRKSGFQPTDFRLAIDVAASEFYHAGAYHPAIGKQQRDVAGMIEFYRNLIDASPIQIMSIEDPLAEHDFEGFAMLSKALSGVLVIGDDLYVTQMERVKKGVERGVEKRVEDGVGIRVEKGIEIEECSAKGIIIKLNQNGTVTGTLDVIRYGLEHGLMHIVSHRSKRASGELIDAYLAVAVGQLIKYGSSRGERVEVYNELLRIERDAKTAGRPLEYAGKEMFHDRRNNKNGNTAMIDQQGNRQANTINGVNSSDLEQMLSQLLTDEGRAFLLYELLLQNMVPETPYRERAVDYFVRAERFSDARRIAGLSIREDGINQDKLNAHPPKDYSAEAQAAEAKGEFQRAAELYESAARNSSSAESYEKAGDAAAKAGQLSFARSMYCKANREYSRANSRSAELAGEMTGEEVPLDVESEDEQRIDEKIIALRDRQIHEANQGIIPDYREDLKVIEKDGDFQAAAGFANSFPVKVSLSNEAKLYQHIVHMLGFDK